LKPVRITFFLSTAASNFPSRLTSMYSMMLGAIDTITRLSIAAMPIGARSSGSWTNTVCLSATPSPSVSWRMQNAVALGLAVVVAAVIHALGHPHASVLVEIKIGRVR
jgi:hypothetical protein